MSNYIPPDNENVFFNFSSSGYEKPDFNDITFNFQNYGVTELQAAISISQLYHNTTYTFTKECRKIIVGYGDSIQILDLPCLFGGIRDLAADIATKSVYTRSSYDIATYIHSFFSTDYDLKSYIRSLQRNTLDIIAHSHAWYKGLDNLVAASRVLHHGMPSSFSSFIRQALRDNSDFYGHMRFMRGNKVTFDLSSTIFDIQPVNLNSVLNVIEISNLLSNIEGIYFKGDAYLYANFYRLYKRNSIDIPSYIRGWDIKNLASTIRSFWVKDLSIDINAGYFKIYKNLNSLVNCIAPKNLYAYLQGYAAADLSTFSIMGYMPNDLQAYIAIIKHENLLATIYGKLGINNYRDLLTLIHSVNEKDLSAFIYMNSAINLYANIDAVGKYLDLIAKIVPKTINIKRILFIPLFEHIDLMATIQYSCKHSMFKDLYADIYSMRNFDLKGYIIGWFSGAADNILDLKAFINHNLYIIQNTITVAGHAHTRLSNTLDIHMKALKEYTVFDTYTVHGGTKHKQLLAYIHGHLNHMDLPVNIRVKPLANFTAIPSWINPDTLEAVINLTRFEERWTRFVEMMFFTNSMEDFHYFYVSGEQKVYKIDKNRTWKIYVTGYSEDSSDLFTRTKVHKKFVFNLRNYKSVDEAIRDLLGRVTLFKYNTLAAHINAYDLEHSNLYSYINVIKRSTWVSNLSLNIKSISKKYYDFITVINPLLYKSENNLTALIVGKSYEPQQADSISFVFNEPGYTTSIYNNINWTYKQAEEFWK